MLYITPGNFKLVQVLVNSVNSMSISATAVDPFYGGAYNPDSISFIDSNPKYLVTARNGIWQGTHFFFFFFFFFFHPFL